MLFFDIETDGLYSDVSKLFCISVFDTKENNWVQGVITDGTAENVVRQLYKQWVDGEVVCGHNIINYDLPTLVKLFPSWFKITSELKKRTCDTLVMSRLLYTHLEDTDTALMRKEILPTRLFKSHRLEAWGYRLGELKGDYGKSSDAWNAFKPEMLEYNKQDVVVTKALYQKLSSLPSLSSMALELEHEVAWLMSKQEKNGFPFDVEKAEKLLCILRGRAGEIQAKLIKIIPDYPDKIFIPKRDNKTKGYKKGVPIQRYKPFNLNSRQQIEWLIREHYHYEPLDVDCYDIKDEELPLSECRLRIDDVSIHIMLDDTEHIPTELRDILVNVEEYLMINKRIGQLADGKNAWLSMVSGDGRIHGSVIPNGAVSGRATHNKPNVAQVPHIGSPYGKECRELFNSGDWWEAGIDACGLELRCLAHFMSPFDNGAYGQIILNGDIHTHNQKAAGLETRDQAKTFIYATLYGAGDGKLGEITGKGAAAGKELRRNFSNAVPAWSKLKKAVEDTLIYPIDYKRGQRKPKWKRHYLLGLDKRHLHVRSVHSALNLLLQSAGALICKKWIVLTEQRLINLGLLHGWDGDFAYMVWCHDEIQVACRTKEIAETVIKEAQEAMRDTMRFFNFRVQLDTEGKIGHNWAECH